MDSEKVEEAYSLVLKDGILAEVDVDMVLLDCILTVESLNMCAMVRKHKSDIFALRLDELIGVLLMRLGVLFILSDGEQQNIGTERGRSVHTYT